MLKKTQSRIFNMMQQAITTKKTRITDLLERKFLRRTTTTKKEVVVTIVV